MSLLGLLTLLLAANPARSWLLETACMSPADPMVDIGPSTNAGCPTAPSASASVACCTRNASSATAGLVCSRPASVGCFDASSTYTQAANLCETEGLRLCSRAELLSNECCGAVNGCPAVPAPTNRLVWTSDSCDAAQTDVVIAPAAAHLIQVDAAPTEINTKTRAFAVYVTYAVIGHDDEPLALKASFKLGRLQQHSFELVPLAAASGSIRFVVGIANEPLQVAPNWKLLLYTVPLNDTRYSQHYEKTTHFINVIQAPATDGPTPGPTAATPNLTPGPTSVAPSPAPTTAGPTLAPSPGPTTAVPTPTPSPGPTVPVSVPVAVTTTAAPATPVPTQGAIMDPTYQPDTAASSTSSSTPDPITSSSSTPDLTTAVASGADATPSVRIATHLFFPSTGWLQEAGNPGLLQALELHFSSYLNLTTGIDWGSAFATPSPVHIRVSFYITSEATWAQVRWATIQNRICLVDASSAGTGVQNRSCAQLSAVGSATVSPGLSVTGAPTDDSNLEAASDVSLAKLIGISVGGAVLFFVMVLVIKWTVFPAPDSKRTSDSRQGLVKQGTRTSVITYDGYAGEDGHRGDSPVYATCDSVLTSATPVNPDIYAQVHKGDLSRSAALPNIRMTSAPRPGSANKSRGSSPEYATCGSITPNTSIAVFSEHPLVVQRQATKFVKPPSVTKPRDPYIEGGTPLATGASQSKMAGGVPDWQPGEEYDVDADTASKPLPAKYLAPMGDTPSPAATPPLISPQGLGANGVELVNGAYDEFEGSDEEL